MVRRHLLYFSRKFWWNFLLNKKALCASNAHSREDERCRKRPRSARECAGAHSFYAIEKSVGKYRETPDIIC